MSKKTKRRIDSESYQHDYLDYKSINFINMS